MFWGNFGELLVASLCNRKGCAKEKFCDENLWGKMCSWQQPEAFSKVNSTKDDILKCTDSSFFTGLSLEYSHSTITEVFIWKLGWLS